MKIRKRFEENVDELVDVVVINLWRHFKDIGDKAVTVLCHG